MWKRLIVPAIAPSWMIANGCVSPSSCRLSRSRWPPAVKNSGGRTGSNGARKSRFAT